MKQQEIDQMVEALRDKKLTWEQTSFAVALVRNKVESAIAAQAPTAQDFEGLAHKIYSAAQLAPGEGVTDAVDRIAALLGAAAQEPLTNDQIWTSPVIMVANAEAGLLFDKLAMVVRATEAAHGITGAAK